MFRVKDAANWNATPWCRSFFFIPPNSKRRTFKSNVWEEKVCHVVSGQVCHTRQLLTLLYTSILHSDVWIITVKFTQFNYECNCRPEVVRWWFVYFHSEWHQPASVTGHFSLRYHIWKWIECWVKWTLTNGVLCLGRKDLFFHIFKDETRRTWLTRRWLAGAAQCDFICRANISRKHCTKCNPRVITRDYCSV